MCEWAFRLVTENGFEAFREGVYYVYLTAYFLMEIINSVYEISEGDTQKSVHNSTIPTT